jgi:hypothetical protein
VPRQVDQLAADLLGSQAEERARRVGLDRLQRAEQTDQGVLQHVVGVGPAAHLGIAAKHLPRKEFQTSVDAATELVARGEVAGPHAGDPLDELRRFGGESITTTAPNLATPAAESTAERVRDVTTLS